MTITIADDVSSPLPSNEKWATGGFFKFYYYYSLSISNQQLFFTDICAIYKQRLDDSTVRPMGPENHTLV